MIAMFETALIFIWIVSAITAAVIMANRGNSAAAGFFGGIVFGVFAVPIALSTKRRPLAFETRCEACAEILRREAKVCPHCQTPRDGLPSAPGAAPAAID